MIVYAADNNDQLPIVTFAPYNSTLNAAAGTSTGTSDPAAALHTYFATGTPQAGSPQAALWMLVIAGQVSPKQFICKSDSYITTTVKTTDTAGNYYNNFPSTTQLSYSIAYPWNADGTPAPFWKNNTDATLPILADMTPKQGTGTPARNLTPARLPADNKTWNSANHQGDGQNVAFADGHVDFTRSPNIGHNNDNIYTTSANPSTGPTEFGGIPAGISPPNLTADKAPYDILMLPIRDQTTGKM